ncbi:MAG: hypothetical protein ABR912_16190 [Terracidiphilus sp.]|jgi:hypothetical protein
MLIQNAVKSINSISDGWTRVEHLRRIPGGLEVCFSIHKGKWGKRLDGWNFICRGVREANISDLNGGGLAVYTHSHPAALQYIAPRAELFWARTCDETQVLAALYRAHVEAVDDWIPFDRYLTTNTPWNGASDCPDFSPVSGDSFVCKGPDFLVRTYAKALEAIGVRVRMTRRGRSRAKSTLPRVLHFGESYIVADTFAAQRLAGSSASV